MKQTTARPEPDGLLTTDEAVHRINALGIFRKTVTLHRFWYAAKSRGLKPNETKAIGRGGRRGMWTMEQVARIADIIRAIDDLKADILPRKPRQPR